MAERDIAQATIEAFRAERIRYVFGLAGWHVLPIYDRLADATDIQNVTVKNENSATIMADVYARLTREPAVVLTTAGPGALNSLPAVAQAFHAASPMLHLTGTVAQNAGREAAHGVDRSDFLHKAFADVTKWSVTVRRPGDVSDILASAFRIARSGRPGPVHVDIPEDVMFQFVEVPGYVRSEPEPVGLDANLVEQAAQLLERASRPVICAGKGVLVCQAFAELRRLAEALSAPVAVAREAMGAFPGDHPLYTGFIWENESHPVARKALLEADLVLAVGLRSGTLSALALAEFGGDRVAFVGFDDEPADQPFARLNAVADSKLFMRALLETLGGRQRDTSAGLADRVVRWRGVVDEILDEEAERHLDAEPMFLGLVLKEVEKALPSGCCMVTDIGNTEFGARAYLTTPAWPGYIQPGPWGAMGFALPAAIATKLALPQRPVLGLTGDGALLMCLGELATAVELGSNIVLLVVNDSRYGRINLIQLHAYGRAYGDALVSPNFAKVAEGFGARGYRVEHLRDIAPALAAALAGEGPAIVDVSCSYELIIPALNKVDEVAQTRWG